MKRLLLLLCLIGESCFADEGPVSPCDLGGWLEFDKPVTLRCTFWKIKRGNDHDTEAKPIYGWLYDDESQTHHSYTIRLTEGSVLQKGARKKAERGIEEAAKRESAEETEGPSWDIRADVHKRPDGRKVFFFNSRGTHLGGFTSLCDGKYELFIMHEISGEDAKRLKTPAQPKKPLTDVFQRIEAEVLKYLKKEGERLDSKAVTEVRITF